MFKICDSNLKIINVSAKWPGSTHDSHIWNESNVKSVMTNLHSRGFTSYFLLGKHFNKLTLICVVVNFYFLLYSMS